MEDKQKDFNKSLIKEGLADKKNGIYPLIVSTYAELLKTYQRRFWTTILSKELGIPEKDISLVALSGAFYNAYPAKKHKKEKLDNQQKETFTYATPPKEKPPENTTTYKDHEQGTENPFLKQFGKLNNDDKNTP